MGRPYDFSQAVKDQARLRQNGKCALCGVSLDDVEEHAHHVIPNQSGNPSNSAHDWLRSVDNCVILCGTCHERAHENAKYRSGATAPPDYYPYSHGAKNSPAHQQWAGALNQRAESLFAPKRKALKDISDKLDHLRHQYEMQYNDHKSQLDLYTKSLAGFWVNNLFNSKPPDLVIWGNAYSYILHTARALSDGDLQEAVNSYALAGFSFAGVTKVYWNWKDGIEKAGIKAQYAIGLAAVAIVVTVIAAPAAIEAIAEMAGAGATAGAEAGASAETQTLVRIAASIDRANIAIRVADVATETEELLEVERMSEIEQALHEIAALEF